jgi:Flp pilus assembly protein TadD
MDDGDWDDWNDEDDDSEGEGFDVHPSSSSHSSSKSGSSSKKYSSTSKDSDELTDEAIDLAESGDVFGALELFKAAAQQSHRDPQLWENLGVRLWTRRRLRRRCC